MSDSQFKSVLRQFVSWNKDSLHAALVNDSHSDTTTGGTITGHGVRERPTDKAQTLISAHSNLVLCITETINIRGSRTADSEWLLVNTSAQWNAVHFAAVVLVPSSDDNTGLQIVLVIVTQLSEQRRNSSDSRSFAMLNSTHESNSATLTSL